MHFNLKDLLLSPIPKYFGTSSLKKLSFGRGNLCEMFKCDTYFRRRMCKERKRIPVLYLLGEFVTLSRQSLLSIRKAAIREIELVDPFTTIVLDDGYRSAPATMSRQEEQEAAAGTSMAGLCVWFIRLCPATCAKTSVIFVFIYLLPLSLISSRSLHRYVLSSNRANSANGPSLILFSFLDHSRRNSQRQFCFTAGLSPERFASAASRCYVFRIRRGKLLGAKFAPMN